MKKIKIVVVTTNDKFIKKASVKWKKYFELDLLIIKPDDFISIKRKKVDLLFIDSKWKKVFKMEYYKMFKNKSERFKLIALKTSPSIDDKEIWKRLYDRIVYTKIEELAIWDTIAILRRYWNSNAKSTTIIYKSIVANFLENKIYIEGKKINLTLKEIALLRILLLNKKTYISKNKLFKSVWSTDDEDHTRVLDQIIFKLKHKIGRDYFKISRKEGVKII